MPRLLPGVVFLLASMIFHSRVLFREGWAMPWDLRGHHLPLAAAYADALAERVLPLWEPYSYCGRPLLANPQTAVFYPGMALVAAGGRNGLLYRLEWLEVIHIALAGLLTYVLARRLGLGRAPAVLAGLVFELGGFLASQVQHLSSICGAPWLVLAWLSLFLPRRWLVPVLSAALALHFFLGFTGYTVMMGVSTFLLALLLVVFRKAEAGILARVAVAGILAAGLAAVQLLPALELVGQSVGKYRTEWLKSGGGLPPAALASMIWPNSHGVFDLKTYHGPYDPTLLYLFAGWVGLSLAVLSVFRRGEYTLVFASLAGIAGLLMMGDATPVGKALYAAAPATIRNTIYWYLFMAAFLLAMALLAAMGMQAWLKRPGWMAAAVLAAGLELLLAGSNRPMNVQRIADDPMMGSETVDGSRETYARLKEAAGADRFDTVEDSMALVTGAPLLRLRTGNGYDPLALERLIQVRLAFAKGERWGAYYPVEDAGSPAVDLMSVRALTSRKRLESPGWMEAAALPGRYLYVNSKALQRYRLVGVVKAVDDMVQAASLVRSSRFNPREEAVAEGFALANGSGGSVRVLEETRQRITLETTTQGPSFLVTSETHYPGWEARIDDQPANLYFTNVAFRGLPVPAGTHRVVMQMRSRSLEFGAIASGVAWTGWMVLGFFAIRKNILRG